MDPISLTVACVSLTASISRTSIAVTNFVHSIRSARSDLDGVSRELASLKTLLELITEDAKDVETFPDTLRRHIFGILANCELVLVEVQRLVVKYDKQSAISSSKWAWTGSEDVARLQLSLEAHKSALEIALEMVTLSMSKQIMNDTTHLRDDTAAIRQETSEILEEIARLRAQLPNGEVTLPPLSRDRDTMLARYLDDLTSYAETVCWSEVNDDDMDLYDDPSPTSPNFTSLNNSTNATIVQKPSIDSRLSKEPNSLSAPTFQEQVSQTTTIESSTPSHRSVETDPFASTHKLDEITTSVSPSDSSVGTSAQKFRQVEQESIERLKLDKAESSKTSFVQASHFEQVATSAGTKKQIRSMPPRMSNGIQDLSSDEPTKPAAIGQISPSIIPSTNPHDWANSGYLQHRRGDSLAWYQHKKTRELLVVKSYRAMDMNIRRLARVEICGLINHPHLASLRYIARTPESWLNYMDPGSATTTLTHYISSFHHNWSRVPPADRVDSGWWENWSCKVARQIGSALRYCYLQYISYGPLESDDVLVTNTGDVKLLGFDLVESQDISRDTQAFTTFTYGIIIWQMACGMPPWSQSENEEKFRNSPSSILARPSGMSPDCFSLISGLLGAPIPSGRSALYSLQEALDHPWMKLVHPAHPPTYIHQRAPVFEPFDEQIIWKLKAMGFGEDYLDIQSRLGDIVNSPEYKTAIDIWKREQKHIRVANRPLGLRKSLMLAVSAQHRAEHARQQTHKPQGGFYEVLIRHKPSPLLATYYLIKERREWEDLSVKKRLHVSLSAQSVDMSKRLDYKYC